MESCDLEKGEVCIDTHDFQSLFLRCLIGEGRSSREFLETLVGEIVRLTGANLGMILMREGDALVPDAFFGYSEEEEDIVRSLPFSVDQGIIGWVARNKKLRVCNNSRHDPHYKECVTGVLSECAAPIMLGKEVKGVINLESRVSRTFTQEQRHKLELASLLSGLFLELEKEIRQNQIRKITLETLQSVSNHILDGIISRGRLRAAYGLFLRRAVELTHSSGGQIFLPVGGTNKLRLIAQHGELVGEVSDYEYIEIGRHICGKVAETGESARIDNVSKHPEFLAVLRDSKSEVAAGIRFHDHPPFGVLNIESDQKSHYTQDDVSQCELFANELAAILRIHRSQKEGEIERTRALVDTSVQALVHNLSNFMYESNKLIQKHRKKKPKDKTIETFLEHYAALVEKWEELKTKVKRPFSMKVEIVTIEAINLVIQEILSDNDLKSMSRGKNIRLHPAFTDKDQERTVKADLNALGKALYALICNACESIPASGGNVWLQTEVAEDWFVIGVADDGVGLPKGFDRTMVKPYVSFRNGKADGRKGHGLGLYTAVCTARLLEGDLRADDSFLPKNLDTDQVRTAFTLRLPLYEGDQL